MLSPLVLHLPLALQLKISLLTSAPGLLVFVIYVYFLLILDAGTHFLEAKTGGGFRGSNNDETLKDAPCHLQEILTLN